MRNLEIITSQSRLTESALDTLAKEIGATLPADYGKFLLTYNGGSPNKRLFAVLGNPYDEHALLRYFLALDSDEFTDIRRFRDVYQIHARRIPSHLLPIASDEAGNVICIAIQGKAYGSVYYWDAEDEQDELSGEQEPYDENIYLLAQSFTEFLDSLTYYDPETQ